MSDVAANTADFLTFGAIVYGTILLPRALSFAFWYMFCLWCCNNGQQHFSQSCTSRKHAYIILTPLNPTFI